MNVLESTEPAVTEFNATGQMQQRAGESVQVIVLWNEIARQVEHLSLGAKNSSSYTIGEDLKCDFQVPPEYLQGATNVPLLRIEGGQAVATIPHSAKGEIALADGSIHDFETLIKEGRLAPSSILAGAHTIMLPDRAAITLTIGPWTFALRSTSSTEKFSSQAKIDWTPNLFTGFSIGAHLMFFFLICLIPPSANGLIFDPDGDSNRFTKYMITPPEARLEEVPEMLKKKEVLPDPGPAGRAHKGTSGKMGDRSAADTKMRYGIKGKPDNKNPTMARDTMKDMARSAGVLAFLGAQNAPTSPFGSDNPIGLDPENALGGLLGDTIGNSFGYNGLGLFGTGRGGGGNGEGEIGVGNLRGIGPGYGPGGKGVGPGFNGRTLGPHRPKGPKINPGTAIVKGSLSKETIRRHVRMQLGRVKFCYEKGLKRNPSIEGRVAIRFIIVGTGAVQAAVVAESTLGDTQVEQCVAQVVKHITFPQPQNAGIVSVTYPFTLRSED